MKGIFILIAFLGSLVFSQAQNPSSGNENSAFTFLSITNEFDLLVDATIVNPECATKKISYYSLIVGTTIIDQKIERISVLIPCLSNQYMNGDLITIKPMKAPKAEIVYLSATQGTEENPTVVIYGAEFRAIWGNVVKML